MNYQMKGSNISDIEAGQLSRNWWVLLLNGILSIIAGILILSIPWTFLSLAFFIGAIFVVRGIFQVFSPPRAGFSRMWNVGIGILSMLAGLSIIIFPAFAALSLITLALFVGFWLLISGIAEVAASISNRASTSYWWLGVLGGALSIALGIFALFRPMATLTVLIFAVGLWAIGIGAMEIALAFKVRSLTNKASKNIEQQQKPRKIA
jgi:uncharacterized membrane protein HdeD (DUF308 family)